MVWICIGRQALVNRVRNVLRSESVSTYDNGTASENHELSETCVQHAMQIIDHIDLLRTHDELSRFSHSDFQTCSSAAIIVLLESVLHPRLTSYSKIRTAMDALRYMAAGSDFARRGLEHVTRFHVLINKALATLYRSENGDYRSKSDQKEGEDITNEDSESARPSTGPLYLPENLHLGTHNDGDVQTLGLGQDAQVPSTALFPEIDTFLEDYSLTNLDLLGFDNLCTSELPDWLEQQNSEITKIQS